MVYKQIIFLILIILHKIDTCLKKVLITSTNIGITILNLFLFYVGARHYRSQFND